MSSFAFLCCLSLSLREASCCAQEMTLFSDCCSRNFDLSSEDILFAAVMFDINKENMACKQYNIGFCGNTIIKIIS